jgi:penicillin-binding protein 1A
VGIHKVIDLTHRFGVTSNIPAYLPIAIGAVEITLQEQVASYSVFPNDGVRVTPRLIRKVENADGITLWEETPAVNEVINQQTARTMMTLLEAVTQHGTGAAAAQLNHPLGGKTGTTSDYTDAWFLGFSPSVTCGVWVGYDSRESLGEKETGARAALPIWMNVMRVAIAGKDNEKFLGDEKDDSKQAAEPPGKPQQPAKPGTASATAKSPAVPNSSAVHGVTGSSAKPAKTNGLVKPQTTPASTGSTAKTPARSAAKPTAPPAAGTKPLVKPALPQQPAPAKPPGTVKPALNPSLIPPKSRNQPSAGRPLAG